MNETVSVVLCSYNGEKYIKEQIDSILNQTYPIYELIIQDDCSTNQTINIINSYQPNSKIKLFCNEKRLNANYNFSSALSKATGDFIAISDQDDIMNLIY
jgi:glycosyltransferase involved in cell wall biosynthesis